MTRLFVSGVMQASHMGGTKLEKRYSPCFRDENGRKQSLSGKRKRDDVFKCVSRGDPCALRLIHLDTCHVSFIIFQTMTYAGP
ncbi:unnamed protein product [Leptidea sinapis]|uniref:Uncharacterized protein n=1 Tax=Leptidea sinapis TaxID=189913 RepID=A0A5E4QJ14_9NEOP|nr:unnamed protein product [Leptidea sinapis]